jgi:TldD protein
MANVSLQAAPVARPQGEPISRVENGLYVVGDKSRSIDMQRYNSPVHRPTVLQDRER